MSSTSSKLQLFTSPSAFPNPQRLRLFMYEKGIAELFEETVYDMTPVGEQRGWRHLKMNPWGETPTLQLADGSFISETAAVVRYLDCGASGFFGHRFGVKRVFQTGVVDVEES